MTASDASLLRQLCPDVLLALHAAQLLVTRKRRVQRAEKAFGRTGNSRSLDRAIASEEQAVAAIEEMLRRIGPLPSWEKDTAVPDPAPQAAVLVAASLLGAEENEEV